MTKTFKFKITYASKKMIQLNEFMSKLDLGFQKFYMQETYEMTYSGEKTPDELCILLKTAFEAMDCEVVEIEHINKIWCDF